MLWWDHPPLKSRIDIVSEGKRIEIVIYIYIWLVPDFGVRFYPIFGKSEEDFWL